MSVPRRKIAAVVLIILFIIGGLLVVHARRSNLIGQWQSSAKGADGATQTTTYRFFSDGLMTMQVQTSQGTLLHASGLSMFGGSGAADASKSGGLAGIFSALFPTVRRINIKGAYSVKDDVLTCKVADVSLYGDQDQPVSLSNETHASQTISRFKVAGDRLTLDNLDGTPPLVLTRQN